MQEIIEETKTDEYISFDKTNYRNPYIDPVLLALEDIYGYMLTYKRPFDRNDIGYLIRKKKGLHENKCKNCYRLPENRGHQPSYVQETKVRKILLADASKAAGEPKYGIKVTPIPLRCRDCRVLKLKQSMNQQIKRSRFLLADDGSCLVHSIANAMFS